VKKRTMKIKSGRSFFKQCPLISPYKLSFVTLTSFQSNFIEIELENGSRGIGEATALPGYGKESFDQVSGVLESAQSELEGKTLEQAREVVDTIYLQYPFAASAVGTALDFASRKFAVPKTLRVPLLYPVSASNRTDDLVEKATRAFRHGYGTIKVKIGKDIRTDMMAAKALLDAGIEVRYRFDANQGYSLGEARQFLDCINGTASEKVEYVEQPLPREAWDSEAILCQEYPNQILLDESIYDETHIRRAADIGARFIKLKLFKTKGPVHLLEITRYAKSLGLQIVLGNGVATDVCNLMEAIAYSYEDDLYYGAFEGNGFLKIKQSVYFDSLEENNAQLIWSC